MSRDKTGKTILHLIAEGSEYYDAKFPNGSRVEVLEYIMEKLLIGAQSLCQKSKDEIYEI